MAKNTETATNVQEMVATNEITFDEIKEAFKEIVAFEFNEAQKSADYFLSGDIDDFDDIDKDEVQYHLERMDECRGIYNRFDEAESFDGDEDSDVSDFWVACDKLNSYLLLYQDVHSLEEFNERYSEIVDADVLQEISKFVFF